MKCSKCEFHDNGFCRRKTIQCAEESKREKTHNIINEVIVIISMILSIVALLLRPFYMKELLLTFLAVMTGLGASKLIKAVVFKTYYLKKKKREDKNK